MRSAADHSRFASSSRRGERLDHGSVVDLLQADMTGLAVPPSASRSATPAVLRAQAFASEKAHFGCTAVQDERDHAPV